MWQGFLRIYAPEDVNTIVTERKPGDKFLEVFEKNNIEVVYQIS
jgi:DeoR/GlpR family transcriptional regulator of sugar metabolism